MDVVLKRRRDKDILRIVPATRCAACSGNGDFSAAPSKAARMRCRAGTVGIGLAWRRETLPDDS